MSANNLHFYEEINRNVSELSQNKHQICSIDNFVDSVKNATDPSEDHFFM